MNQKGITLQLIKERFGVVPTEAQLKKLQELAKNEKLTTDTWVKMAEKILKG